MTQETNLENNPVGCGIRPAADIEVLVELVWLDLDGRVSRRVIEPEIRRIVGKYKDKTVVVPRPSQIQKVVRELFKKREEKCLPG